ncbi:MAG: hypothetical protein L6R38_007561 [Xanthoria sp. 2 TBL-2021]|nr:MAG: hypothetical protein L6R38_007561 [Xanthoria sp. 2 TBL-2021]
MPDPCAVLPLPLPIFIFNDLEDLVSLHVLLVASPSAYRIFNVYYTEILSCILTHYPPHLLQLLRIILSIRSQPAQVRAQCSPSMQAFDAFRAATILDKNNSADTVPLSKSITTPAAARSLAKTAAQVQGLMKGFFETHFKRVNSVKPHCPRNKSKGVGFRDQWTPLPNKEFVPYDIIPFEEPSWIEEQRVLRALWRAVAWFDLLLLLAPREGGKDEKSGKDINQVWSILKTQQPTSLWATTSGTDGMVVLRGITLWEEQEMNCVISFLKDVPSVSPCLEIMTADDDHPPPRLQKLPSVSAAVHYTSPLAVPRNEKQARMWRQWMDELDQQSPGTWLFQMQKGTQTAYSHPLGFPVDNSLAVCPFEFLQTLGIAIWDGEKLARLGLNNINRLPTEIKAGYLLGPPRGPRRKPRTEGPSQYELVVRWRSLFIGHTS